MGAWTSRSKCGALAAQRLVGISLRVLTVPVAADAALARALPVLAGVGVLERWHDVCLREIQPENGRVAVSDGAEVGAQATAVSVPRQVTIAWSADAGQPISRAAHQSCEEKSNERSYESQTVVSRYCRTPIRVYACIPA